MRKKGECLMFKHEGEEDGMVVGPLFWMSKSGGLSNYKDGNMMRPDTKTPYARWYTLKMAREIAKAYEVKLEET